MYIKVYDFTYNPGQQQNTQNTQNTQTDLQSTSLNFLKFGIEKYQVKKTKKNILKSLDDEKLIKIHESQNKNMSKPSSRKEVIALDNWLSIQLDNIKQHEKKSLNEIIDDMQIIYSACLKEIIRQVSIQCTERGQLIQKVWEMYLKLIENAILENNKEKVKLEKDQVEEVSRIHHVSKIYCFFFF